MVEIAKALSRDARLIVLDEPSAVLADAELDGLFRVMRRLTEKGVAFIYISHRLNEVFRITDRVVVMKDGRVVASGADGVGHAGATGAADGRARDRRHLRRPPGRTLDPRSHPSDGRADRGGRRRASSSSAA